MSAAKYANCKKFRPLILLKASNLTNVAIGLKSEFPGNLIRSVTSQSVVFQTRCEAVMTRK